MATSASTPISAAASLCTLTSVALTKCGRRSGTRTAVARWLEVSFACCVDNSKSPYEFFIDFVVATGRQPFASVAQGSPGEIAAPLRIYHANADSSPQLTPAGRARLSRNDFSRMDRTSMEQANCGPAQRWLTRTRDKRRPEAAESPRAAGTGVNTPTRRQQMCIEVTAPSKFAALRSENAPPLGTSSTP
jgi:hypothetical protein